MTKRPSFSLRFLYFVLLWCVFSFKVFLGGIQEAGLRVDDLLLAIALVVLVFRGDLVRIPRSATVRAYLTFILISLCSAVWNGVVGRVSVFYSLVFVIRLMEYIVFYYLGYVLLENGFQVWRWLRIYFYLLCVAVPLQMVHLLPTASSFDVSRASGNTNGPYELAAISAFFFCYFGYREHKRVKASLSAVLLILTAARSTITGVVLSLVLRFVSQRKSKRKAVMAILLAGLVLWGCARLISSIGSRDEASGSVAGRLYSSSTLMSVDYLSLYAGVPTYRTSDEYVNGMFSDSGSEAGEVEADKSGMLRVFRWASLIKSTTARFDSILIGMGPSFGSAAVDGYYVRVFIETGLAGLIAFLIFVRTLIRHGGENSGAFREFIIILMVTGVFIDIFASYKTMLFLWLWCGISEYESTGSISEHAYSLSNEG
jgi:hypothetical protein